MSSRDGAAGLTCRRAALQQRRSASQSLHCVTSLIVVDVSSCTEIFLSVQSHNSFHDESFSCMWTVILSHVFHLTCVARATSLGASLSLDELDEDALCRAVDGVARQRQRVTCLGAAGDNEALHRVDDGHLGLHDGEAHANAVARPPSEWHVGHWVPRGPPLLGESETARRLSPNTNSRPSQHPSFTNERDAPSQSNPESFL